MRDTTETSADDVRIMECPFCGHRAYSTAIGAVYCGPHGNEPARRMFEVRPGEGNPYGEPQGPTPRSGRPGA